MAVKDFVLPTAKHFYQSVRTFLIFLRKQDQQLLADRPVNVLHFTSSLKLTAAETEVEELVAIREQHGADFELMVNDFGLLGAHGALPHGYTEWIAEQIFRHNDIAIKHFLDMFNHRLNALRFDIWKKRHLFVAKELDDDFRYPAIFNAMAGVCQQQNDHLELTSPDNASLWNRRTLVNLVRLLQIEFNCQVQIIPFQGVWGDIEKKAKGVLGSSAYPLGAGVVLGRKCWDIHASFHIKIGPIEQQVLITEKQKKLKTIVQHYVSQSVIFSSEFTISTTHCNNTVNGKHQLGLNALLGKNYEGEYISIKYSH